MASPPRGCAPSTSPDVVNGTLPITIQANVTDTDAGQNTAANFYVGEVGNLPNYMLHPTSAFQAQNSALTTTFAAGTFSAGKTYAWWARGSDNIDQSPGSTPYCYFTIKNSTAAMPTITTDGSSPVVGKPMTVTFHTAPGDRVAGIAYWWGYGTGGGTVPVLGVDSAAALPVNGSGVGNIRYASVANPAIGDATAQVAPVDKSATLRAVAYDLAGNVSGGINPQAVPLAVIAANDPGIGYSTGHGWITDNLTPSVGAATTVPDENQGAARQDLSAPAAISVVADGGSHPAAFAFSGYTQLSRSYNRSLHDTAKESGFAGGYTFEKALGQIAADQPAGGAGTTPLYRCTLPTGHMTATTANCDGLAGATSVLLGYGWTSAANVPTSQVPAALYRCLIGADHFDSLQSNCEGQTVQKLLVYLAAIPETRTAAPVVDTIASFTVSAWLKPAADLSSTRYYNAVGQSGASDSGFTLQVTNVNLWRFCIRPQSANPVTACATSSATVVRGQWSYVTGMWDAINQQVRITVSAVSVQPDAVAYHAIPAGDFSPAGPVTVGSGLWLKGPANQWRGLIENPVILPGILSSEQLSSYATPGF